MNSDFTKTILTILIAVFTVLVIGTLIIPALVAYLYSRWQFLLIYPGVLALLLIYAAVNRK